jgi:hypothetical protein
VADVFYPEAINPAVGGAFGAILKNAMTCGDLAYGAFPELLRLKGR